MFKAAKITKNYLGIIIQQNISHFSEFCNYQYTLEKLMR